jgi:hypothetical protein
MKIAKIFVASILVAALWVLPVIATEQSPKSEAMNRLNSDYPGLKVYSENDQLSRVYGKHFGYGTSPEERSAGYVQ